MRIKEYLVRYPESGLVLPTPFIIPVIRSSSALQSSIAALALILLIIVLYHIKNGVRKRCVFGYYLFS